MQLVSIHKTLEGIYLLCPFVLVGTTLSKPELERFSFINKCRTILCRIVVSAEPGTTTKKK
jgi:hypothetical protein